MSGKTILLVSFLSLILTPLTAQADEAISLKVGYLMLAPSGDISTDLDGIGTDLDVENDLNLDDSENLMVEGALAFGDMKLTVAYIPLSFEGSSILSRDISFNGIDYSINTPVNSSFDVNIFDIGLTYFLINIDDVPTRFQLGLEFSVKVAEADATVTDSITHLSESVSGTLPIPTIGLRARVAFSDFVGIAGRIGYLGYSDNHFLDGDIQVEFSPLPFVGIFAGYRYIDIAIDESDVYFDNNFAGFYGGALVRF